MSNVVDPKNLKFQRVFCCSLSKNCDNTVSGAALKRKKSVVSTDLSKNAKITDCWRLTNPGISTQVFTASSLQRKRIGEEKEAEGCELTVVSSSSLPRKENSASVSSIALGTALSTDCNKSSTADSSAAPGTPVSNVVCKDIQQNQFGSYDLKKFDEDCPGLKKQDFVQAASAPLDSSFEGSPNRDRSPTSENIVCARHEKPFSDFAPGCTFSNSEAFPRSDDGSLRSPDKKSAVVCRSSPSSSSSFSSLVSAPGRGGQQLQQHYQRSVSTALEMDPVAGGAVPAACTSGLRLLMDADDDDNVLVIDPPPPLLVANASTACGSSNPRKSGRSTTPNKLYKEFEQVGTHVKPKGCRERTIEKFKGYFKKPIHGHSSVDAVVPHNHSTWSQSASTISGPAASLNLQAQSLHTSQLQHQQPLKSPKQAKVIAPLLSSDERINGTIEAVLRASTLGLLRSPPAYGSPPFFGCSPGSPNVSSINTSGSVDGSPKKRGRKPLLLTEEEREARKQEYKKKLAERLKEKRRLERQAKEEAKALHDDLSLSDLRPLPLLPEVDCGIPLESLGDLLCIAEFTSAYSAELGVKDYFSQGLTFDILVRAFTEKDAMGILVNIIQILLGTHFRLHEQDRTIDFNARVDNEETDRVIIEAQERAAAAGREFYGTFGFSIHSVPLDSFTYSDVLRWHLETSGAPGLDLRDRVHCHQGFAPKEDPGLRFVLENADIMKKLESGSVASLDVVSKIKLVRCLVDQLLTFELFRVSIEEGLDRCIDLKIQLKKLLWRKKILEDEEKGPKRDSKSSTDDPREIGDVETKKKNWRYDLPNMPRQELEQRIIQTEDQINKVWYRFGLSCLGEDRGHRIYNVMHSVPAIIVEVLECVEAPCVEGGTPLAQLSNGNSADFKTETTNLVGGNASVELTLPGCIPDPCDPHERIETLSQASDTPMVSPEPDRAISLCQNEKFSIKSYFVSEPANSIQSSAIASSVKQSEVLDIPIDSNLVCNGDARTCMVHARKQARFFFVQTQKQFDILLDSLAPKGVRENVLRETLINEIEYLSGVIKRTPVSRLNRNLRDSYRRKYASEVLKPSNVAGLEADVALDLTFREVLLDFEAKLYEAMLGGFKADEARREAWRAGLDEPLAQMQELTPEQTNSLVDTNNDELKRLASALLECACTVPSRFLKAPFSGDSGLQRFERWKSRLPVCVNFSQLFLFYSSFEASIQWHKGLNQARCKVCRGKVTPDRMVRCDRCDAIFHLLCLKPALRDIPLTNWLCKSCTSDSVPEPVSKKVRPSAISLPAVAAESSIDATDSQVIEENNDYCEVCGRDDKLVLCSGCPRSFHVDCLHMKRAPRGDWRCPACNLGLKKYRQELRELRKALQERTLNGGNTVDPNQCTKCGELLNRGFIECKGCPKKYHLVCADLLKRPKGDWYCRKRCEPGYVLSAKDAMLTDILDDDSVGSEEDIQSEAQSKKLSKELPKHKETELLKINEESEALYGEADVYDYKTCCDILDIVKKSNHAWPFLAPVTKKDAPDYHKIIKKPMDLGTVQIKLNESKYSRNSEFVSDMIQIFINCERYNAEEAEVYREGKMLFKIFINLVDSCALSPLLATHKFKWLDVCLNRLCIICDQEVLRGSKNVSCDECSTVVHLKCAGVKNNLTKWTCPKCLQAYENVEEEALVEEEILQDEPSNSSVPDDEQPEIVDVEGFDYKACTDLLDFLLKDEMSVPFRRPVTKKEAPDYLEIITRPMDLSTIQNSLNNMKYQSNRDFVADIALMFNNCERYNHESSGIYLDACCLWEKTVRRLEKVGFDVFLVDTLMPQWNTQSPAHTT